MASKEDIKLSIEATVKRYDPEDYKLWRIGTTTHPVERKTEWDNPKDWHMWEVSSKEVAADLEKHFTEKGMKGARGGDIDENEIVFVYIF